MQGDKVMIVYVCVNEDAYYEYGSSISISVYQTYASALKWFETEKKQIIEDYKGLDMVTEAKDDWFCMYEDGYYNDKHTALWIEAKEVE